MSICCEASKCVYVRVCRCAREPSVLRERMRSRRIDVEAAVRKDNLGETAVVVAPVVVALVVAVVAAAAAAAAPSFADDMDMAISRLL